VNVPYQFNYSQIINGTLTHIPTDYNYAWLNVTQFPVVTSPHRLVLYGDDIQFINNNTYFVGNKVLGRPVAFHGVVLDYFDKPADGTQFHVTCINCYTNWSLVNAFLSVDNISPLYVNLVGEEVVSKGINVTLNLLSSISYLIDPIEVSLIVELVPCPVHTGYYYSDTANRCVCYRRNNDVVNCYENYNEIKGGYWFGTVNGIVTTSLCPNQNCQYGRKTRNQYYILPNTVGDQCEQHRIGPACGECSPGYTLAYDSTDCISIDNCSVGIIVLVVVLTVLYWIVIVVGVFILMYFNLQFSVGFFYGIVYYYSLTDILLSYNPNVSGGAIQFIKILSGFVQLTPQPLRQLCLVERMTTIDQLFIHSFHAGAVLTLLSALVFVTRYSRKVSAFVSRCIIRILCLLLLLVYTSLSSTLLQQLRPLTFTGINDVYTSSSPNIRYFHGRHLLYGIVAVFCEIFVVIGVPLLLLSEKLLNRKINLVKLKPIIDQFKGCYKDKYRWFVCFYMICRQVIIVIVSVGENNYSIMLLYLQTACIIIATIHIWFQPYKNKFLNFFDGMVLVLVVLMVNINTFDVLQSITTVVILFLVILPLVVLFVAGIVTKMMYLLKRRKHHHVAIISDEDDDQRYVRCTS